MARRRIIQTLAALAATIAVIAAGVLLTRSDSPAAQQPPESATVTVAVAPLVSTAATTSPTATTTTVPASTTPTTASPSATVVMESVDPVGEEPDVPPAPPCDEGNHAHDGECHPDHAEPAETEEVTETEVTEPAEAEEVTETADTEGGEATGLEDVMWWRPGLSDEAFDLVDPDQVGADHVIRVPEDRPWGTYRYYLFYHGIVADTYDEDQLFWQAAETFRRTQQEASPWVYYPYRYDMRWVDYPTEMQVTATYPLGEELVVVLRRAGDEWVGDWEGVAFPTGPPIRPTTPFAEPRFPDTAQALGRDCPPVEELWEQETEVTDPCTIAAVTTALDYAWTGPAAHRMAAVRDGHTLEGVFAYQDSIDDPPYTLYYPEAVRATLRIEVESVRWAGSFPQASMVLVEYRFVYPPRQITDELRQALTADHDLMVEYMSELYPDYTPPPDGAEEWLRFLEEGGPTPTITAVVVRTADGTWRRSYREFCTEWITTLNWAPALADRVVCPPDPTPWFPDSHIYDRSLEAPNHIWYYTDPREDPLERYDDTDLEWTYDRGGMEDHRLAGPYSGVPPT